MTLALSSALLHFVWQGALIAMILAVTLHFAQRSTAQTRYVLACGALLLMVLSFGATFRWMLPPSAAGAPGPAATAVAVGIVLDAVPQLDGLSPQGSRLDCADVAHRRHPVLRLPRSRMVRGATIKTIRRLHRARIVAAARASAVTTRPSGASRTPARIDASQDSADVGNMATRDSGAARFALRTPFGAG